jgi:hypothetical protein
MRRIDRRDSYANLSLWSVVAVILIIITFFILWRDLTFGLIFLAFELICVFLWIKFSDRNKPQQSDIEHLRQMKRDYNDR